MSVITVNIIVSSENFDFFYSNRKSIFSLPTFYTTAVNDNTTDIMLDFPTIADFSDFYDKYQNRIINYYF